MKCKVCSSKLKYDRKFSGISPDYSCRNCKPVRFKGEIYSSNYIVFHDNKEALEEFFFVINNKTIHVMNHYKSSEFEFAGRHFIFPKIQKYSEILRKAKRLV